MEKDESRIGVFDSGLGGLTVVDELMKICPSENIIYFGDTAHMPYGTKTKEQLTEYTFAAMDALISFGVKAVIIACNTADSVVGELISEKYDLPVFGVITPTAKQAVEYTKNGKIGVMATNATIDSGVYEKEIHTLCPDIAVTGVACPKLVPLIEQGHFTSGDMTAEEAIDEYLAEIRENGCDTLILGCTHYPLLSRMIKEKLPNVNLISSSAAAAKFAAEKLGELGLTEAKTTKGKIEAIATKDPDEFCKNARKIVGESEFDLSAKF